MENKKIKKIIKGKVVNTNSDKTIKVEVETYKNHPIYHKRYKVTKLYQVHDPLNKIKKDEVVQFQSARPFSKTKRFKVIYSDK